MAELVCDVGTAESVAVPGLPGSCTCASPSSPRWTMEELIEVATAPAALVEAEVTMSYEAGMDGRASSANVRRSGGPPKSARSARLPPVLYSYFAAHAWVDEFWLTVPNRSHRLACASRRKPDA